MRTKEEDKYKLSPQQNAFLVRLLADPRRNASKAARDVGMHEQSGRRLVATHPGIKAALAEAEKLTESRLEAWANMGEKAQKRLNELLDAEKTWTDMAGNVHSVPDNRVRLGAVKEVLDRELGKARQHVEVDGEINHTQTLDENMLRVILSLVVMKGWTTKEAYDFAMKNPEAVDEWVRNNNSDALGDALDGAVN